MLENDNNRLVKILAFKVTRKEFIKYQCCKLKFCLSSEQTLRKILNDYYEQNKDSLTNVDDPNLFPKATTE